VIANMSNRACTKPTDSSGSSFNAQNGRTPS
jgi:hypothetical protein